MNLGKLRLDIKLDELKLEIIKSGFEILPLDFEHIIGHSNLEPIHRDPFDKIIISQAISEKCTVISRDSNFNHYTNLQVLW